LNNYDDHDDYYNDDEEYYYEPDQYEIELKEEYKNVKEKFINNYINEPINQKSFFLLKDVFNRLEEFPIEPTSLRKSFIRETISQIKNQEYKKKFLTEIFLYQFKGLNLSIEPTNFLKILYNNDTFEFAKLFYKNNHYSFIMKFILEVVNSIEKKESKNSMINKSYNYETDKFDDSGYEYSDVLYWDAVHEGEIVPEDPISFDGGYDCNNFDHYDDYDVYNSRVYTDPAQIALNMEKYIIILKDEIGTNVPIEDMKQFLAKFKKYVSDAERKLYDIELNDLIASVFEDLVRIGSLANLDVRISENYDKTILFTRKNGDILLQVDLSYKVDDKENWLGNNFSLRINNIKANITNLEIEFVQSVMQAIGYNVKDHYINFIKKCLRSDDYSNKDFKFPSGLKLSIIQYPNEFRHFLKWKDI
jgi:hypothetical protein